MTTTRPNRFVPLLASIVLAAGGCASKFQSEWKSAAAAAPQDHLSGRWKGSWKSDKSGHSGGLRCVASRTGDDAYRAHFNATYALLFRFGYTMHMTADVREDTTYVAGEEDLGKKVGGVYEYEGQADGKTFRLNYRTKNDYGHFTLTRPK
jgi:hypothetical protein